MKVGTYEIKEVSELNNKLYEKAKEIMLVEQHKWHIGWSGVGSFIDWLEENYELKEKPLDYTE